MKYCMILALVAAIAAMSRAALTVDAPATCATLGTSGTYGYDPTTDKGPASWGKLSADYTTCGTGSMQSPVDMPRPTIYTDKGTGPQPNISVAHMEYGAGSSNWALTCVNENSCGSMSFGGEMFHVFNLHLHSPSEHLLDGKQYPLEAHLVHVSASGELAVITTMFDYPPMDTYAADVYETVPKEHQTNELVRTVLANIDQDTVDVNLGGIVHADEGYCSYVGSLTTPPCSEGVTFFMALHTETVTRRQVAAYRLSAGVGLDGNNRPTMPLNGRKVTAYI